MPRIELELDDKGDVVGDVPAEIAAILKRVETTSHGVGYGKGVEQAAKDAKKQIEDAIALEKARFDALQPLERERVSRMEADNQTLSQRLTEASKEHDRTLKQREEAHARQLVENAEQLKRRNERIQTLTAREIRMEALQAGARDESLDELEVILGRFIGYDDDMLPFVRQADGSPQLQAGKPVPLGSFVKQYLDNHPHHRRAATGRGGDARRGASLSGTTGAPATVEAARQRFEGGDRSPSAINDIFEASRKKRAG